jgi:hypothetical protein
VKQKIQLTQTSKNDYYFIHKVGVSIAHGFFYLHTKIVYEHTNEIVMLFDRPSYQTWQSQSGLQELQDASPQGQSTYEIGKVMFLPVKFSVSAYLYSLKLETTDDIGRGGDTIFKTLA